MATMNGIAGLDSVSSYGYRPSRIAPAKPSAG